MSMTTLFVFQFVLPIFLIGWMTLAPPRTLVGMCLQVSASAAALWAMALLGIWLLPPWWAPYAFGVALLVAAGVAVHRRRPFASTLPVTWGAWTVTGLFVVLGVASAYGIGIALRSRTAPPLSAVTLALPLEPGVYLVVNGGRMYGVRVLAPCAGRVLLAVDDLPDMQVPEVDRAHLAGNHVMLRCTGHDVSADVLLGHLRPGSVQVRAGSAVAVGDWLGSAGNSGNSGEPHLHVHAQRPGPVDAPLGGDPLPILFAGHFAVRGDRIESR